MSKGEIEERIGKPEASSLNTKLVILSKMEQKNKLSDTKFCIVINVKK